MILLKFFVFIASLITILQNCFTFLIHWKQLIMLKHSNQNFISNNLASLRTTKGFSISQQRFWFSQELESLGHEVGADVPCASFGSPTFHSLFSFSKETERNTPVGLPVHSINNIIVEDVPCPPDPGATEKSVMRISLAGRKLNSPSEVNWKLWIGKLIFPWAKEPVDVARRTRPRFREMIFKAID